MAILSKNKLISSIYINNKKISTIIVNDKDIHYTGRYIIDLAKFNIFNNNTNPRETTLGINNALKFAREQGFREVQLPKGDYLIENDVVQQTKKFIDIDDSSKTWSTGLKGIIIPDNIDFIAKNCNFNLQPSAYTEQSVIVFANSHNSRLTGGAIIGDRHNHLFDLTINKNSDELESGDIDITTGLPIDDPTRMRTVSYIDSIENGSPLPQSFIICPLENTTMNTVDGGCRYIYCYDNENNYLGKTDTNTFIDRADLIAGTTKIKISFRGEQRTDAKYYLTTEKTYITFEQSYGIRIYGSNNITITGTTIKDFLTDGIITMPFPINHTNNNVKILNCTIENNRRQGISLVGSSDSLLIKGCKIGKTQGVDPQCGIDFEHYTYVTNTVIDGCDFYDNKKWDIINYNSYGIEIKNCRFNGAIGSTFGYNMLIHNNKFVYHNDPLIDKSFKGVAFAFNTNSTEDVYFKLKNNSFSGYNATGGSHTSSLASSEFTENTLDNSCIVLCSNASRNTYMNSTVRYSLCDYEYRNETLISSTLTGENNGGNSKYRYYKNFNMNNCTFSGGNPSVVDTIFSECNIYNNSNTFSSLWSGPYTMNNCNITTEFKTNIPFISSQGNTKAIFNNCIMDLSCTPFVAANYGILAINNSTINFNQSYESQDTINFYSNVYGSATFENNRFYKDFEFPKVKLPDSISSSYNDNGFTSSIVI